jgi:hypothetical protein
VLCVCLNTGTGAGLGASLYRLLQRDLSSTYGRCAADLQSILCTWALSCLQTRTPSLPGLSTHSELRTGAQENKQVEASTWDEELFADPRNPDRGKSPVMKPRRWRAFPTLSMRKDASWDTVYHFNFQFSIHRAPLASSKPLEENVSCAQKGSLRRLSLPA